MSVFKLARAVDESLVDQLEALRMVEAPEIPIWKIILFKDEQKHLSIYMREDHLEYLGEELKLVPEGYDVVIVRLSMPEEFFDLLPSWEDGQPLPVASL